MPKSSKLTWSHWPLIVKLTVTMVMIIIIIVTIVTVLSIRREQQTFQTELQQQATLLLDSLADTISDPLYTLDVASMTSLLERLVADETVTFAQIYDQQGRVMAEAFDPKAVYDFQTDSLGRDLVASDTTRLEWDEDRLLAGKAVIVGTQRLGAISMGFSTAPLQAKIASTRNQGLLVAVVTVAFGILVAILISQSITRPLEGLVSATRRIAGGDLNHKITVESDDELAVLGRALEGMRIELHSLYQGLEQQVAERTQELQESQERFRRFVSSLSDHIYVTEITEDGQHLNNYISPNVEDLTGYPYQTFVDDWSFWPSTVIHPDDRAAASAQARRLAGGQDSETEYRLTRADGHTIWVRDSGRVDKHPRRQSLVVYGVVSDITERKRAEAALALARDQALEASRLKSELLSKVSHELRTPLGVILGYTEMIQEGIYGPITDKQRETTTKIIEGTQYLADLVTDLLDQAALEAGKFKLRISSFAPADIIEDTLSKMTIPAKNKGLTLTADIAPDLPGTLSGDPDRIKQILINLIGNAIKFTSQGSIHIGVYQPDSIYWALAVSDTGPGIPPEAQAQIFEPFGQVDGSATRTFAGTGLGLALVEQLTTLMGGQVTLESEVGQGSTFTVLLPKIPVQENRI